MPTPSTIHEPNATVPGDITARLVAARAGGKPELDGVFELVYDRLRRLAQSQKRSAPLDATELVHEAYLRFVDASHANFDDRRHFFAAACKAMRQILVDHARRRMAQKRGAGALVTTLGAHHGSTSVTADDVIAVDEALVQLGRVNPRLVQVVEACFFLGLSTEEAGDTLGLSARTVKREWQKAKMLLGVILAPLAD